MTGLSHITRRSFVAGAGAAVVGSRAAWGQQAKLPLVAILSLTTEQGAPPLDEIKAGLAQLGYIEGRNIAFVTRYADNQADRLLPIAQELVALGPTAIVASSTGAQAAAAATSVIPIVMRATGQAVADQLVGDDYGHPKGNATGIFTVPNSLVGKQVQTAAQFAPGSRRIGVLLRAGGNNVVQREQIAVDAAAQLGVTPILVLAASADDLPVGFRRFVEEQAGAVAIVDSPTFDDARKQLVALAVGARLPAVFASRQIMNEGALAGYVIDDAGTYRRAAYFVDRILKGARPQDLPFEVATPKLVVNLRAARDIGLTVPSAILARADEVIE